MGVGRESARTAIQRSIDELNEINDLLSSDAENQVCIIGLHFNPILIKLK